MKDAQESKSSKFNAVFIISIIITLAVTLWGIVGSGSLEKAANALFAAVTKNFGWLYLITVAFFVVFCLFLAFSKYGKIVLGPDGSKPEFSTISWFAMLFGSGMGIGIIFWGAAEPITHFANPIAGIEPGTEAAAQFAIKSSFMHWGLHPWSGFAIMGLGLAYFQFRKNKPGLISSLFYPLIGEKGVKGPLGKAIDILAAVATVFGVGTSLGLGTMQINGGLSHLLGIPQDAVTWLIIIVVIAIIYLWTAISGVDKGIQLIGNINLAMATLLLVVSFIVGPSLFNVNLLTTGIGAYISDFVRDSFMIKVIDSNDWIVNWRVFYWAWWIAWCPFVGTFIARISRGRTIREFVMGVMVIPTVVSLLWFATLGGMGMNLVETLGLSEVSRIAQSANTALFEVFSHYPLGIVLSIIAIGLVITFFVTSANSATYVLGMLSDEGKMFPAKWKLVVWGVLEAALAYALMLSGGISSLQTASIAAAFPFIFIMIIGSFSTLKGLKQDVKETEAKQLQESGAADHVPDVAVAQEALVADSAAES